MMRIVLDMQGAQTESRTRGIGRYTLSFAEALARNNREHEIVLALNGLFPQTVDHIRAAFERLLPRESIRVWYAPGPVREAEPGNDGRRQAAELIREAFLASLMPDTVHVTSLFEGFGDDGVTGIGALLQEVPTSVTLYDLIPMRNLDHLLKFNPPLAKWYLRKLDALKRANLLLAISQTSLDDAREALSLPSDHLFNVSAACSSIFRPITLSERSKRSLLSRLHVHKPFILCASTIEAHKNLAGLLRAYACLPMTLRFAHQLVLVGKANQAQISILNKMVEDAGIERDDVVITDYISDDDLVALYNSCTVTVVPSFYEGFGLPALEAMSCGAPVIGSNAPSISEVIGHNDWLFDPADDAALTAKLVETLTDDSFRTMLKLSGLEQARKFSWDQTAKRALRAFESFARTNRNTKVCCQTRGRGSGDDSLQACIDAIAELNVNSDDLHIAVVGCLARNHPPADKTRQLFVDVSELKQRDAGTGCQRVTRSVLLELLKNPPPHFSVEPVYATIDRPGYRYARSFAARFMGREEGEDLPVDFNPTDIFFGLDYQAQIVPAQREYLLQMKRHGVRLRFLVHDILPVTMACAFPDGTEAGFRQWLLTIAQFDGVICVSRATADDLRRWYAKHVPDLDPKFGIDWVHNGADVENSAPTRGLPKNAAEILANLRQRTVFLMVGTIEPRKGHDQILSAFRALWAAGHDVTLVIIGRIGWAMEAFIERLRAQSELGQRLFWLQDISDEYLEKIYAASTCQIAASEGEGFGLPLIEGARHRLPVIARDIPVFREVAGENAFYFNGNAPADLAHAIEEWLALHTQGRHPSSERMPCITWAQNVERLKPILLESKSCPPAKKRFTHDDVPSVSAAKTGR
jgi:glycosyltransferase involved in cell wall biosynthesis